MKKWLTAYRNEDYDYSLWPTDTGLRHATIKNSSEAASLLELTEDERRQLERNGELYKDIDGVPYQISMY